MRVVERGYVYKEAEAIRGTARISNGGFIHIMVDGWFRGWDYEGNFEECDKKAIEEAFRPNYFIWNIEIGTSD